MLKNLLAKTALVASLALSPIVAGDALAQKNAGDLLVRLRGIAVMPDESSKVSTPAALAPAGKVDVGYSVVPEADFTYFITKNIALELIAGTTRHTVKASGGALNGTDLGHVWLLPPTLSAQYHILPDGVFSPYVGAGLNYTFFYNESIGSTAIAGGKSLGGAINKITYKDNWGWSLQVGTDVQLDKKWYANFDVKKLFLRTDANVSTIVGAVKAKVDIDPWIVGVGIGYKF